jgi:hypothetical protein
VGRMARVLAQRPHPAQWLEYRSSYSCSGLTDELSPATARFLWL